jgi:Ser/Thr protein kinase RdoA (MazF antagonist)
MAGAPRAEQLPEPRLNDLLRQVDWRFLLPQEEAPRVARPLTGPLAEAVRLIACEEAPDPGAADLAVTGFPRRAALADAAAALRPGGAIVCAWRAPRPNGAGRAAAALRRAGFSGVGVHWPGPIPYRLPQFWLPPDSEEATSHLLAQRPPDGRVQATLRPLWRAAARVGLLAPLYATGRLPGGDDEAVDADGIAGLFPESAARLLLTGGRRSINKVVGMSFAGEAAAPPVVVKFARVATADEALDREATALSAIERDHPLVSGVPRLLATGRRAGRRALAESAVHGDPLIASLSPESFGPLSRKVGSWLLGLAGQGRPRPASEWWQRRVGEPLAAFERDFGAVVEPGMVAALRSRLEALDDLPEACEHRDCSPWNVVLGADGEPGLLDWESAEPHGLPGLDLAYFLANAAFVLDGAIESGQTRESYLRLLDQGTAHGREAAACVAEYRERVSLSAASYARLRLLCWVVHSRSDHRHLSMAAAGPPSVEALRGAPYLGLIEAELERRQA